MKIVIANSKNWFSLNKEISDFHEIKTIENVCDLQQSVLEDFAPDFIFFPHWNWTVPKCIHEKYKCILFHTAPLPYGRGGSPIQNLILNGFKEAPVCALKMTDELDAGPIYAKKNVSLKGNLENILESINKVINCLIRDILKKLPEPQQQSGDKCIFKRLKPSDSELPKTGELEEIYDRIRMVDHPSYPSIFIRHGNLLLEFSDAELSKGEVKATCRIVKC